MTTSLSPFGATHNRTDDQSGQDAKLPQPVQREHPPCPLNIMTRNETSDSGETPDRQTDSSDHRKSFDWPMKEKGQVERRGLERVRARGGCVGEEYAQTCPPREHWLRCCLLFAVCDSNIQEPKRILMRGGGGGGGCW